VAAARRPVRWSPLALSVVVAVLLAACSGGRSIPPLPHLGPVTVVNAGDFGDPSVLTTGGREVVFGTDDPPDHVPTATSTDLVRWVRGPDAVPQLPTWADPDPRDALTWAPAAAFIAGRYLLYVSVQDATAHRQCIAVLASHDPLGPYRDARGSPLVCQVAVGGSIDPSVAAVGTRVHLVWKSDGNCCGIPVAIWEQDLDANGLALVGSPHRLLTADLAWQGGIIEDPALLPGRSGGWWLFYSGNMFDRAAYGTGVAWCPSLDGPCLETSSRPFLSGTATQYSPGGLDFFRDPAGRLWAAFATWDRPPRAGRFYCCRALDIAPATAY
jgi:Glycosyl hydrolases family 43